MTDIEYYKSIDSPTLSNAIELLNVRPNERGFTPLEIKSLFPEFGRMCGYAVTAQVETVTEMQPFTIDTFIELYRLWKQRPSRRLSCSRRLAHSVAMLRTAEK